MKNFFITILLLVLFFSCEKQKSEYPDIIVRHNLEEQFDLAKWELYKLNCVDGNDTKNAFLFKFENEARYDSFLEVRENYRISGKDFRKDKSKLIEILGKENVVDFIECELEWLEILDSSKMFKDDEIHLTFFPKCNDDRSFIHKLGGLGLCYTIVFKQDSIIRYGCGDYREWSFTKFSKKYYDEGFLKILKKRNKKIHPWVSKYYQINQQ